MPLHGGPVHDGPLYGGAKATETPPATVEHDTPAADLPSRRPDHDEQGATMKLRSSARTAVLAASLALVATATAGVAAHASTRYLADADDPAVTSLAAELGIPVDEAQRRIGWQIPAADLQRELAASLGERFGGLWIDEAGGGRIKVGYLGASLDDGGAIARLGLEAVTDAVPVRHGHPALEDASAWLGAATREANAGADAELLPVLRTDLNAVELRLPDGHALTERQQAVVDEAQRRFGTLVVLGSWQGRIEDDGCAKVLVKVWNTYNCDNPLRGGVGIYDPTSAPCSTGFTARGRTDGKWYVLTAGHCTTPGEQFTAFQPVSGKFHVVGAVHTSIHTGVSLDDMATIAINNVAGWNPKPWVYVKAGAGQGVPGSTEDQDYLISGTATSPIGTRVCMSGALTGTSCGKVLALNVGGPGGLIQAGYCRQGGDSGGSVLSNHRARGLHKGSLTAAKCGEAVYQDITEAEDKLNVDVVTELPISG